MNHSREPSTEKTLTSESSGAKAPFVLLKRKSSPSEFKAKNSLGLPAIKSMPVIVPIFFGSAIFSSRILSDERLTTAQRAGLRLQTSNRRPDVSHRESTNDSTASSAPVSRSKR